MVRLAAEPSGDRVIAMEALARWTTPDGVAVPPSTFVPLAEEIGLGTALGLQVLQCGLDAVAGWYADDHTVGRLAVNLAQSQLDDAQFVRALSAQLDRRSLPPTCLVIEIASASFIPTATAVATLQTLRGMGVEVLLDDFGVQGLSLAALASLPLSGVKLHPAITVGLLSTGRHDPPDAPGSPGSPGSTGSTGSSGSADVAGAPVVDALTAALPAATLALCRALGLRCVLEGIESQAQLDAARALGVDAVQGFLIAGPARARDVSAMLESARGA
jgi:EAL domain-containing protein (putative c-di-GMP-specific phosphodiesterase class I)